MLAVRHPTSHATPLRRALAENGSDRGETLAKRTATEQLATKQLATEVVKVLRRHYREATCSLDFDDPLQLLIATILSAQCTDERVNVVTKPLFKKYRSAAAFARAPQEEIEEMVRSTGFFRNKAKAIRGCCQTLVAHHQGAVPETVEQLVALPGVGRKTANVVLGTAFGIAAGIAVDTHVGRISRRLGLSDQKNPDKVAKALEALVPKREWIALNHRMIQHGRQCCMARSPRCDACPLASICPRIGVATT